MTRPALLLLASIALLSLAACVGGTSTTPPGTLAPEALTEFKATFDCVTLSYPTGWQLETKGDLTGAGRDYCPGGNLTASKVVECNTAAVGQEVGLIRVSAPPYTGETQAPAQIEVDASPERCSTLKDHFDRVLASEQGKAIDIGPADDATIAGYPARCAQMTFAGEPEDYSANVCAFEAGTDIYLTFQEVAESRISELKPVLIQILDTLHLIPLPSPPSPSPAAS